MVLAAVGASIVIYNTIRDEAGDIEDTGVDVLDPFYEDTSTTESIRQNPRDVVPPFVTLNEDLEDLTEEELKEIPPARYIEAEIFSHSCVVHFDGTISCWGKGESGQLGDGIFYTEGIKGSNTPVKVLNIDGAVAVSMGDAFSCALHEDTTISCWGSDNGNVLGNAVAGDSASPVKIIDHLGSDINGFTSVSAGFRHACALHNRGTITCWGDGWSGQLGNRDFLPAATFPDGTTRPVQVKNMNDAVAVSAGAGHTCALHPDNTMSCWGNYINGELGTGTEVYITSQEYEKSSAFKYPAKVINSRTDIASNFAVISAGSLNTCALHTDNTISCWGVTPDRKCCDGTTIFIPKKVTNAGDTPIDGFQSISVGDSNACGLKADTTVWCWGSNYFGELGNLDYPASFIGSDYPVQVSNIAGLTQVMTRQAYACGLYADGTMSCWGNNSYDQLANTNELTSVIALGN